MNWVGIVVPGSILLIDFLVTLALYGHYSK